MEKFYDLSDICLIPTVTNQGHIQQPNFNVIDPNDQTGIPESLPIFTSPMEAVVGKENVKLFVDAGIKPVLPLVTDINVRLEYCQWIFCAFSIPEVKKHFIDTNKRGVNSQFHICIDAGNGHDANLLQMCGQLKRLYGSQVVLIGSNIGCPEVYTDCSRAGLDYVRVGIASGSLVDPDKYGFDYPMASLLEGIKQYKKTSGVGLPKQVKIIADGGIRTPSDIVKALALGADYVMIGREFARLVEAYGPVYQRNKKGSGDAEYNEIDPSTIQGMEGFKAKINGYQRQYHGNTSLETRAMVGGYKSKEEYLKKAPKIRVRDTAWEWVEIDSNLEEWVEDFKRCAYYAFMMTGSTNWENFKKVARYGVAYAD